MRQRLAMLLSITALLVAVLGVTPLGEAALNAVVPKNSVGTPQLQWNAVKAAKIAPNAVRTGAGRRADRAVRGPFGPAEPATMSSPCA